MKEAREQGNGQVVVIRSWCIGKECGRPDFSDAKTSIGAASLPIYKIVTMTMSLSGRKMNRTVKPQLESKEDRRLSWEGFGSALAGVCAW